MVGTVCASLNPRVSGSRTNPKRSPLLRSEVDNGVAGNRRPKSRELASMYMSSTSTTSTTSSSATSSNSSSSRRYQSPLASRTVTATPPHSAIKRSQSAERRRLITSRPNTPCKAGEVSAATTKLLGTTTRSLSVSFQGESFSLSVSKVKPVHSVNSLGNVRKGTPERRKVGTPVRDQTENSNPVDRHRWPGRLREVNSLSRSLDCTDEKKKLGRSGTGSVVRALQQSMIDESRKHSIGGILNSTQLIVDANSDIKSDATIDCVPSDRGSVSSESTSGVEECVSVAKLREGPRSVVVPARFRQETSNRLWRLPEQESPVSENNGFKTVVTPKLIASQKLLNDGPLSSPRGRSSPPRRALHSASSCKPMAFSTSSPSRRNPSPSQVRNGVASTLRKSLSNTPSMLCFAADIRRGKMGENRLADLHLLKLFYNRQLQWRFVNARTDTSLLVQRVIAEKSLYNAWVTISKLRYSVKCKRLELHLLKQNLKLYSILKGQVLYLDGWDLIDRDHSCSLSGAIEALEASTLRLPVVGGAKVDIQNMKDAICSAADVMQAMASLIRFLLPKDRDYLSFLSQSQPTDQDLEPCKMFPPSK
ncbi:QWRF motif-containing protein 2-like isoform X2 [Cornus florida]|uniref:QWRF motif-containing protein 2-like isoform X2 n=1 Tax=Cornus florida TaxID=4283 RepID=UPI00289A7AD6|nr:QWRF motif-containing protein 2-like isoform X2 [Cornus florida]